MRAALDKSARDYYNGRDMQAVCPPVFAENLLKGAPCFMRTPLMSAAFALPGILALAFAAPSAQAQTPPDTKSPTIFAVRGGAYFPFNSTTKRSVGKTWASGGLDYVFQQKAGLSRTVLSVDYIERSSGGNTIRLIPVTIGQFTLQGAGEGQNNNVRPYLGIGVGAYFVHQALPDNQLGSTRNDTTTIGGYLGAGLDISSNFLVEARYHILPKVGGINSSGLQITAGVRF